MMCMIEPVFCVEDVSGVLNIHAVKSEGKK